MEGPKKPFDPKTYEESDTDRALRDYFISLQNPQDTVTPTLEPSPSPVVVSDSSSESTPKPSLTPESGADMNSGGSARSEVSVKDGGPTPSPEEQPEERKVTRSSEPTVQGSNLPKGTSKSGTVSESKTVDEGPKVGAVSTSKTIENFLDHLDRARKEHAEMDRVYSFVMSKEAANSELERLIGDRPDLRERFAVGLDKPYRSTTSAAHDMVEFLANEALAAMRPVSPKGPPTPAVESSEAVPHEGASSIEPGENLVPYGRESEPSASPVDPSEHRTDVEESSEWKAARDEYRTFTRELNNARFEYLVKLDEYESLRRDVGVLKWVFSQSKLHEAQEAVRVEEEKYNTLLQKVYAQREKRIQAFKHRLTVKEGAHYDEAEQRAVTMRARVMRWHAKVLDKHIDEDVRMVEAVRLNRDSKGDSNHRLVRMMQQGWRGYRNLKWYTRIAIGATAVGVGGFAFSTAAGAGILAASGTGAVLAGRRIVGGSVGRGAVIGTKLGGDALGERYGQRKLAVLKEAAIGETWEHRSLAEERDARLQVNRGTRMRKHMATAGAAGAALVVGAGVSDAYAAIEDGMSLSDVPSDNVSHVPRPPAPRLAEVPPVRPSTEAVDTSLRLDPSSLNTPESVSVDVSAALRGGSGPYEFTKLGSKVLYDHDPSFSAYTPNGSNAVPHEPTPMPPLSEPSVPSSVVIDQTPASEAIPAGSSSDVSGTDRLAQEVASVTEPLSPQEYMRALTPEHFADPTIDHYEIRGTYEPGASVQGELIKHLAGDKTHEGLYPGLTPTEAGKVAFQLQKAMENFDGDPALAQAFKDMFGVKKDWNVVPKNGEYAIDIPKDMIDSFVARFRPDLVHTATPSPIEVNLDSTPNPEVPTGQAHDGAGSTTPHESANISAEHAQLNPDEWMDNVEQITRELKGLRADDWMDNVEGIVRELEQLRGQKSFNVSGLTPEEWMGRVDGIVSDLQGLRQDAWMDQVDSVVTELEDLRAQQIAPFETNVTPEGIEADQGQTASTPSEVPEPSAQNRAGEATPAETEAMRVLKAGMQNMSDAFKELQNQNTSLQKELEALRNGAGGPGGEGGVYDTPPVIETGIDTVRLDLWTDAQVKNAVASIVEADDTLENEIGPAWNDATYFPESAHETWKHVLGSCKAFNELPDAQRSAVLDAWKTLGNIDVSKLYDATEGQAFDFSGQDRNLVHMKIPPENESFVRGVLAELEEQYGEQVKELIQQARAEENVSLTKLFGDINTAIANTTPRS